MIQAPEHLSRAFHDTLDDPRRWVPGMRPPLFDSTGFQKQIDRITGVPGAVKIQWAPDWLVFKARAIGETVREETTPAQSALTDPNGNSVSPPRWMAVERLEPEQWLPGWEQNRWFNDPRDRRLLDLRGPAPAERFQFLFTVAEHDDLCCVKRMRQTLVCWGYYRAPNEADLFEIKARWSKSLADPVDPHLPANALRETQYERDVETEMRDERRRDKDESRLRARELLGTFQPSEIGQLLAAAKQRYVVTAPGKQIHNTVEKIWEKEKENAIRNFDA